MAFLLLWADAAIRGHVDDVGQVEAFQSRRKNSEEAVAGGSLRIQLLKPICAVSIQMCLELGYFFSLQLWTVKGGNRPGIIGLAWIVKMRFGPGLWPFLRKFSGLWPGLAC